MIGKLGRPTINSGRMMRAALVCPGTWIRLNLNYTLNSRELYLGLKTDALLNLAL